MSEYRSPLTGHDAPRRFGDWTGETSAVCLRGRRPASLVQIAGWADFEARC